MQHTTVMELSIVMPCLNEALTLPTCIKKAKRYLEESGVVGEVIVADNGSTDGSIELAEELGARVVNVPIRGYGAALSAGIHAAHGTYVIMGDSDDSYNFLGLQPFVDKLREGHDLVMGNRFKGGISPGAMPLSHRFFGNPMLTLVGRRIYDHDVCGDFYCGLRGFRKEAIQDLSLQSTGMEFALEMIIKSELRGLKITEVPTTLSPDGRDRKPHLNTYRDGWRSLRLYLLLSPRWTFGIPGLISMLLGAIALAAGVAGLGEGILLGVLLMFGSVAMILGYQSTQLAIFAKFIAIEIGLHPPETKFWMLRDRGTLERVLIGGSVLTVLGMASAAGVAVMAATGGNSFVTTLALATISGTLLVMGGQTVLSGFYFGILHLMTQRREFPRKRRADMAPPGRRRRTDLPA